MATILMIGAQIAPTPGPGDPRLQVVTYDPHQVVRLDLTPGYQLTVMFAPDERFESVAIGDPDGWQATTNQRGDYLFVKPITGNSTNMTVITDARVYNFELGSGGYGPPAYSLQFNYPTAKVTNDDASPQAVIAGRYKLGGARSIRPHAIHDDGIRTYIEWADDAVLPAVFGLDERGNEILTDGNMIDGIYTLSQVYSRLVFRLDRQQARADRSVVDR